MIPSIISLLTFADDSAEGADWSVQRPVSEVKRRGRRSKTHVLESPYNNAGALICCLPSLHRLHLNVSWVSHIVSMLNLNNWRKSSWVKCRAVSSASSTTHAERFCFWHLVISFYPVKELKGKGRAHCLWKIFSSIVPVVWNRYTKPARQSYPLAEVSVDIHSFFWPSRHTRAKACWSLAGFQSYP